MASLCPEEKTVCPPQMADGRQFTDYRTRVDSVQNMLTNNWSSYEYRQHLINNAEQEMDQQRNTAHDGSFCTPCKAPYDIGTMLPETEKIVCTSQSCKIVETPFGRGIGRGREYKAEMPPSDQGLLGWSDPAKPFAKALPDAPFYPIGGI